jgi:hypothetical protein
MLVFIVLWGAMVDFIGWVFGGTKGLENIVEAARWMVDLGE